MTHDASEWAVVFRCLPGRFKAARCFFTCCLFYSQMNHILGYRYRAVSTSNIATECYSRCCNFFKASVPLCVDGWARETQGRLCWKAAEQTLDHHCTSTGSPSSHLTSEMLEQMLRCPLTSKARHHCSISSAPAWNSHLLKHKPDVLAHSILQVTWTPRVAALFLCHRKQATSCCYVAA